MCIDKDRFIDEEFANDLICSICQNVLCCPQSNKREPISVQEPYRGSEGGCHKFCEKCIKDWLKMNPTCPECRKALNVEDLQPLERFASNTLKRTYDRRLKVHCKRYKQGCKYVDKLELIEQHELNNCDFGPKECKKCGLITILHTNDDCINRLKELLRIKDNEIQNRDKTILLLKKELKDINEQFQKRETELNNTIRILKDELNVIKAKYKNEIDFLKKAKSTVLDKENEIVDIPEIVQLLRPHEILDRIKLLVETKNANVNYQDKDGMNALIAASSLGLVDIVKYLIEKGINVSTKNKYGVTALKTASSSFDGSRKEISKILIEHGVNVNDKDEDGMTALMSASSNGYLEIAKLLIEKGAVVNDKKTDGYFKDCTALIKASMFGHFEIVKLLIEKGANVNDKYEYGTALIEASSNGYLEITKLLIENGADVNAKIENGVFKGVTALITASKRGHLEIVKLLILKGAEINDKNKNGWTALQYAIKFGNQQIVDYLRSKGGIC